MITLEETRNILGNMKELLSEYDYMYDGWALEKIIDEWANQKAELIEAFKKHPKYVEGEFLIAFDQNYERDIDKDEAERFYHYILNVASKYISTLPAEIQEQRITEGTTAVLPAKLCDWLLYNFLGDMSGRIISEDAAKRLEAVLPQIHPHAGQKTSRVVNKIMKYLNYDKDPDYNKNFAKFADALSPMSIKRHTILSINPLDYLTMSFGNSWASCHTIDKINKRKMPNSYEGQYSSGTISYMLDTSSMVFYTVDSKYDGSEYWTQPKINRQMFHWGAEKLVQGRLYPQDNDGNDDAYAPYRQIVQSIMSTIFDFPNLWKLFKGAEAASKYIISQGTHYRDYECYSNCTLSRLNDSDNDDIFTVGAEPICIECGNRHSCEENINCCEDEYRVCEKCGARIYHEDDEYWVGDYCYCQDCVTYCEECGEYELNDNVTFVGSVDKYVCDWCLEHYYTRCDYCGEYIQNDDAIWVESTEEYVCCDCIKEHFTECDYCGEYIPDRDIKYIDDTPYCESCYERMEESEED